MRCGAPAEECCETPSHSFSCTQGQEPSCPGECGLLITLEPEVESILFRPDQTAFNPRIDGDVTDPDLFHFRFPELPREPRAKAPFPLSQPGSVGWPSLSDGQRPAIAPRPDRSPEGVLAKS